MSAMGEPFYSVHAARTHLRSHEINPYSPVSSFTMPIHYDSSLITPVSLTQSQPILSTPPLSSQKILDIKLSPSQMSPTYPWLGCDDDYGDNKTSEMKHKDPPGTRRISPTDSSFPASPVICYAPYFGQFGVSATPVSTASSSGSMIPSPRMNAGEKPSGHNTSPRINQTYSSHNQPNVLLSTPSSLTLRPSSVDDGRDYRHASLQPTSPGSLRQSPFPEAVGPLPPRRKRKPIGESQEGELVLAGEMTTEEQILIRLSHYQSLPWKEVATRFKEQTGKAMKVPALQMRKKRLIERLRVWTPSEEQALVMAWEEYSRTKWETIASNMPKYGCSEPWPKELVRKKWQEMHPGDEVPCVSDYEVKWGGAGQRDWSDGGGSRSHSLHEGDATHISTSAPTTATIETGTRSRTGSGTASPLHFPPQPAQMMYDSQQSHGVWGAGG